MDTSQVCRPDGGMTRQYRHPLYQASCGPNSVPLQMPVAPARPQRGHVWGGEGSGVERARG